MSSEASQRVLLYFLELVINTKKTFTISQLAGHFGNEIFTAEMRTAAGVNEKGLREFLLCYPSLFTIQGNIVSQYNEDDNPKRRKATGSNQIQSTTLPDVCLELEAVKFFAQRLAKRQANWVPIQCLTGHFSQLTADMRRVIGPQVELKKFLMRHDHVFEVSVEMVRLRKELLSVFSIEPESFKFIPPLVFKDPTSCSLYSLSKTSAVEIPENEEFLLRDSLNSDTDRGMQHSELNQHEDTVFLTPISTCNTNANSSNSISSRLASVEQHSVPVTMTLIEYSAVMFLKSNLENKGSMKVCDLMEYTKQRATKSVRDILGSSKLHFENFLKQYPQIFSINFEEIVALVKNAKLCVIVTGNGPSHAEHSRSKEIESRKFQTLTELGLKSSQSLGNPKIKPVRIIHTDKENEGQPAGDHFQRPISGPRYLTNSTFEPSNHHSCMINLLTLQESCIPEVVKDVAKSYASVACQTLATNDIIATQLYIGN